MTFSTREAERLYGIDAWGKGYFGVNAQGHLTVHPTRGEDGVDLFALLGRLQRQKVRCPVQLRFPQILESRVEEIFGAFAGAIAEFNYGSVYRGVYPIKVNQHPDVVGALVAAGRERGLGLEAGTKAELAIALSHDLHEDALIICNGYKDASYVRLALRGVQLGRKVMLIVEKPQEVPLIIRVARELKISPLVGMRIRLRSRSSGKWEGSSGAQAKFGLTAQEVLDAVSLLKEAGMLDSFRLLHFHAGSQITEIKRVKNAVKEGARVYAKLRGEGCRLEYLDVGGGLGVDYDGSGTSYEASMNYTVREYANDVVYIVQEVCVSENVPSPVLISESGRALTAYHSMIVSEVGGQNLEENGEELIVPADAHESLQELHEIFNGMNRKNHREYLHDAEALRDELFNHFELGYLSLRDRALAERIMLRISRQALGYATGERFVPDEIEALQKRLVTKYIANFSVFQSIPDSWALDQLFPVVPIHRLDEEPSVQATLCDVTCDSFGEVDRFVDLRDVRDSLPLHPLTKGEPYYIAVLLTGAYQDVLGDHHNLFGRVDEVHVRLKGRGRVEVEKVLPGQASEQVLKVVGYDAQAMRDAFAGFGDGAVKSRRMSRAQARRALKDFEAALADYTYLDFHA